MGDPNQCLTTSITMAESLPEPTDSTPCSTCQHPLRSHKKSRPPACRRKACECNWFENRTPEQQLRVEKYFSTLREHARELAKEQ